MNQMGYIYKVTNKANGKVYIGKTEGDIRTRWNSHVSNAFRENSREYYYKFHNAIRKYGRDSFTIEVIDEVEPAETANREQYWIEYYDSIQSGYNTTCGGEGCIRYSDEFFKKCWESGLTYEELRKKYGISTTTISTRYRAVVGKDEIDRKRAERLSRANGMTVYRYDLEGNYIDSFCSVQDAMRKTGIKHVDAVARGKRNHAGGYVWSYKELDKSYFANSGEKRRGEAKRVTTKQSTTGSEEAA